MTTIWRTSCGKVHLGKHKSFMMPKRGRVCQFIDRHYGTIGHKQVGRHSMPELMVKIGLDNTSEAL